MASKKLRHKALGVFLLGAILAASPSCASVPTDVDIQYLGDKKAPDPAVFQSLKDFDAVGMVVSLKGKAFLIRRPGRLVGATLKAPVLLGDSVRTERDSSIKIAFLDQSELSLAGETEVVIKDFLLNSQTADGRSEIWIKRGRFSFYAGQLSRIKPENYKVATGMATIGIRGSAGVGNLSVDPEGIPYLDLAVKDGHVLVVTNRRGETRVLDNARIGLRVYRGGLMMPIAIYSGYFAGGSVGWTVSYPKLGVDAHTPRPAPASKRMMKGFAIRWRDSQGIVGVIKKNALNRKIEQLRERASFTNKSSRTLGKVKAKEFGMRDPVPQDYREQPSATPTMNRLAREMAPQRPTPTALRKDQVEKERSTSMKVLHRLGQEIQNQAEQKGRVEAGGPTAAIGENE